MSRQSVSTPAVGWDCYCTCTTFTTGAPPVLPCFRCNLLLNPPQLPLPAPAPPPPPRMLMPFNASCFAVWTKTCVCAAYSLVKILSSKVQNLPRMAREWHPVEEFTTLMLLAVQETAVSPAAKRDRLLSMLRLYPDFSEGFQGGGDSRCAVRLNLFRKQLSTCAVIR